MAVPAASCVAGSHKQDFMYALARHIGTGLVAVVLLLSGLAHAGNPPVAIDDAGRARSREGVPGNIARATNNWPGALVDPGRRKAMPDAGGDR